MIQASWLNVGSLILGLIAWGAPVYSLIQYRKGDIKKGYIYATISFSACALSLCMQIFYTGHLVNIQDWTALLDTHAAVSAVAFILLIGTILMNVLTLTLYVLKSK